MAGLIDIHQHLIRAIDEDPADGNVVRDMLRSAAADGIRCIVATPHVIPGVVPFDAEEYGRALDEMRAFCAKQDLPIQILGGAEVYYTCSTIGLLDEGRIPTMNGTRFVLAEWDYQIGGEALVSSIRDLTNAGYLPIVAHAERYACLTSDLSFVATLRRTFSMRLQANCASILKKPGFPRSNAVKRWLREELVDYMASDAHNTSTRRTNLSACYEELLGMVGREYADALTHGNQLEIVE